MQTYYNDIHTEILKIFVKTTVRIIFNTNNNLKLRKSCLSALSQLKKIVDQYIKEFYNNELSLIIFKKKSQFIINAKSKQQLNDILKPSLPNYNGEKYCSEYHLKEEELLLLSLISLNHVLNHIVYKRFIELFLEFYSQHKNILKKV